jgi:hypothetical protein
MRKIVRGEWQIFRYDTFGDEAFWDQLHLHEAIRAKSLAV